jgi:hypothetical protein
MPTNNSLYENYVNLLEDLPKNTIGEGEVTTALETACDCLSFVQALWEVYQLEGAHDGTTPPDIAMMENLFDALQGELAAASLFLSENSFSRVPDMLRSLAEKLEGHEDDVVPVVVARGFSRFANRIENVRKQQQLLMKVVAADNEQTPVG